VKQALRPALHTLHQKLWQRQKNTGSRRMCADQGCVTLGRREMYENADEKPGQRPRNAKVRLDKANTASGNA
jgi:hypothetical protein